MPGEKRLGAVVYEVDDQALTAQIVEVPGLTQHLVGHQSGSRPTAGCLRPTPMSEFGGERGLPCPAPVGPDYEYAPNGSGRGRRRAGDLVAVRHRGCAGSARLCAGRGALLRL